MCAKSRLIPVYPRLDGFGESRRTQQKRTNNLINTTMKYTYINTLAAFAGLALTASSANAALTVTSYTYDAAGVPINTTASIADPGNLKLTDGVYPISAWSDGANVGWKDGSAAQKLVGKPSVTFNLGGLVDLTTVDIWTEEQFRDTTESVTISSSTDGSTWGATTVAIANINWVDQGATYGDKVTIDVSSLPTGQYYKMVFVDSGQWTFLTEVDFEGSAVPEPSTTALLGLGGLALILRRRK
jgi:hypothetical protein